MTDLAPFKFSEYEGSHSVILSDADMGAAADLFEEHGYEVNGYAWAGVARSLVVNYAPELDGVVRFDPEAGMFSGYGRDQAAVQKLAVLLHKAFNDRTLLAEVIAAGEPEWFD